MYVCSSGARADNQGDKIWIVTKTFLVLPGVSLTLCCFVVILRDDLLYVFPYVILFLRFFALGRES